MNQTLMAIAETEINAPIAKVWDALVNPGVIKKYMWGTTVESDWAVGSDITWSGEWEGKPYKDTGKILQFVENTLFSYSHASGSDGEMHTVTVELTGDDMHTHVKLMQDGSKTEEGRAKSEGNWKMMLGGLKKVVEK